MKTLRHEFVEYIPEILEAGVIYITMKYRTAVHLCVCGCSYKVVTPFSPKDWKLIFDGKSVSLYPSIGNFSYPCKSHYWITNNHIMMADEFKPKKRRSGKKKTPDGN